MGYLSTYFDDVSPVQYKTLEPKNKIWRCIKKQGNNVSLNEIDKKRRPKVSVIEKEYYAIYNQDWSYPDKKWPKNRILRVYNPSEGYRPINGFTGGKPGCSYVDIVTLSKKPSLKADSRVVEVETIKPDSTAARFKLYLKKRGSKIIENNSSKEELKSIIKGNFPATVKKYAQICLKLLKRLK